MNLVYPNRAHCLVELANRIRIQARAAWRALKIVFKNSADALTASRLTIAAWLLLERPTRCCDEPAFRLLTALVDDQQPDVSKRVIDERPFGRVIAFDRELRRPRQQPQPPFGQVIAFNAAL